MKRFATILQSAALVLAAAYIMYWFAWIHTHREFPLGEDLHRALGVLNRVQTAEARCYQTAGHFAPVAGMDDGFTVVVQLEAGSYTARVHPASSARLHSLYLDPSGQLHFGTRDWPATATSRLLASPK